MPITTPKAILPEEFKPELEEPGVSVVCDDVPLPAVDSKELEELEGLEID